jgi:hypothetical protein
MFDALRGAYDEARGAPVSAVKAPSSIPPASIPLELSFSSEPSLVVDVTFGDHHDEQVERERQRTREVVETLSELSIAISSEDPKDP